LLAEQKPDIDAEEPLSFQPTMNLRFQTITLVFGLVTSSFAAPPAITSVRASQRAGTKLVDVTYTLADPDSGAITIQAEFSANAGTTYDLPAKSLTGAIGANVAPGAGKVLTWDAGKDWNGNWSDTCKVRLWAHDGSTPVPPLGMVYIPNGTFDMGSGPGVAGVSVTITKGYFMDRTEVSAELWNEVRNWGLAHGYDIPTGNTRAPGHPIHSVNWYDCIKWCNARSEKEGLTPVYFTDSSHTIVYRTLTLNISNGAVDWAARGYRLPTEAEWERAARGGLYRKLYPWGDIISGSMANFANSGDPFDNGTTPCGYFNGHQTPPGADTANGFGLYDVSGNLWEWCWDWWSDPTTGSDPRGNSSGIWRVLKGSAWDYAIPGNADTFAVGYHGGRSEPPGTATNNGFRSIRGL
jgi:formylglycine-generating enzyme required for sulfatase activity